MSVIKRFAPSSLRQLGPGGIHPELPDPWVPPSGWSFPSGHAMGSFVTHGFLAYLLTRVPRGDFPRRTVVALLAVLVLLIGFSWIYLGAH